LRLGDHKHMPAGDSVRAFAVVAWAPDQHRKLWLLNDGHSLLAYAGSIRGHAAVADAVAAAAELVPAVVDQSKLLARRGAR